MDELKKKVDAWLKLNLTYDEKVEYCRKSAQHFNEYEFVPFSTMSLDHLDSKVKYFHDCWIHWNN